MFSSQLPWLTVDQRSKSRFTLSSSSQSLHLARHKPSLPLVDVSLSWVQRSWVIFLQLSHTLASPPTGHCVPLPRDTKHSCLTKTILSSLKRSISTFSITLVPWSWYVDNGWESGHVVICKTIAKYLAPALLLTSRVNWAYRLAFSMSPPIKWS